ncbi:uncharacterized protein LOC126747450 [Anthonomus grandis grandis]|uniref:uncharacterized protein LOC126747450 n=1 Tax=Anthonomus grandis grandis TaxID=2921223 RepID=UPI0021663318|nr:uncharacterized protein LOC126747450 [Anthonomus grandis grandis]
MKSLFKIWTLDRKKKSFIVVDDEESGDLYAELILKASTKFGINGSSLVLEEDGTPIDNECLSFVKEKTFTLLAKDEKWFKISSECGSTSSSMATTVTVESDYSKLTASDATGNSSIEITTVTDCNTEYYWHTFEIPYEALSEEHKQLLEKGVCPKQVKSNLVHLIVNKMRSLKKNIPSKAFKIISKKLIDKYPVALRDIDEDGIVLGDGTHSLMHKLQERNNYLNRPHKNTNLLSENPVKTKKRQVSASAGCTNWSPQLPAISEEYKSREEISSITEENFVDVMEKSYAEQRQFLNRLPPPSITEIQEDWPILLSKKAIFWHFSKLTSCDIHLLDQSKGKIEKLVRYCQKTTKGNENSNPDTEPINDLFLQLLKELTQRFKEKLDEIYVKFDKNLFELVEEDLPITPVILHIQNDNISHFWIYLEKQQICSEGYETLEEAFKVLFAIFFNLNIKYPPKTYVTLELIQRYIFKIHPDTGSKSKNVAATKKKIFSLLNKLA